MGANVGTSLTNTAVSMILYRERRPLRRAFGAATMHDIFNILPAFLVMAIENVIVLILTSSIRSSAP